MASRNATIADAIVTALNGHTFSPTFTAVRRFVPRADIIKAASLIVTVVPGAKDDSERISRDADSHDIRILIGVEKYVSTADVTLGLANAEIDPLLWLVEQIDDFCTAATLASVDALFVQSGIINPVDVPTLLNEKIFRGIVAADFLKVV